MSNPTTPKPRPKIDTLALIIVVSLVALFGYIWFTIFSYTTTSDGFYVSGGAVSAHNYFLDVGQGDSELIIFPSGVKVMTDAGPTQKVLDSLEKALAGDDHYIDIAIISHPQLDHANGYNFMLDGGYEFGAFIYNGRDDTPGVKEWSALLQKIKSRRIPLITLGAGDKIHINSGTDSDANRGAHSGADEIDFLSPDRAFAQSAELNDTAFVELVKTSGFRTLLTADIGMNVERSLIAQGMDFRADVLKIGHHGSKYSSGEDFLRAVAPKVAVIEVGAKNTYGHPSKDTLARLASSTRAAALRTDQNGTVKVWSENGKLKIAKEKR